MRTEEGGATSHPRVPGDREGPRGVELPVLKLGEW